MYDIGKVKGIHFCLLVFARGKWKKNYGETLTNKLQSNWLKIVASKETELFDPKKLGKKLGECKICAEAFELFKKEKGKDNGFIRFSHFVPEDIKSLLGPLIEDPQVQKVYYLEQNSAYFLTPPDQFIAKLKSKIKKQVSIAEFFRMVDQGQFETGVLYKIFPRL